mmetsp:Transcript_29956/g.45412  ORF Transcript_29956/g.45412 Transcript_29956/m.45412 type:complete len:194 (-) Transcript_29956:199-780(-)|eukprot:CAMPEP_0178919888 /NCGR_PEP_ID=MMETSP0786-20121207/14692_1 /TAXON_ID=186022 /ORGANISM="Thalassionema frauenfeldii, Strain CCMP 1798" /LENGTH=193 /DNA_ID=CAMNT_0020593879 /DNA_START=82 /DNA_END=663 /DNA_ORIENTATION=+
MLSIIFLIQLLIPSSIAFLSQPPTFAGKVTSTSSQNLLPGEATNWIATIDSDIANIPENEFAPVFLGGLAVIAGGFVTCFIVALIIEKFDLYGAVNGDTYRDKQLENGKEVWRDMPEEEKITMQEIMGRLQAKEDAGEELTKTEKEGMKIFSIILPPSEDEVADEAATSNDQQSTDPTLWPLPKEANIFSDYD